MNQPWVSMCPNILTPTSHLPPTPSLWVVPEHKLWKPCFMHRTCTGHLFYIWQCTCFSAILSYCPTLAFSHIVQREGPLNGSFSMTGGSDSKDLPAIRKTWVRSLGQEDPLGKGMATHSSIPAWRIPWAEKPGGLQSMGLQRVGHDRVTFTFSVTVLLTEDGSIVGTVSNSAVLGDLHWNLAVRNFLVNTGWWKRAFTEATGSLSMASRSPSLLISDSPLSPFTVSPAFLGLILLSQVDDTPTDEQCPVGWGWLLPRVTRRPCRWLPWLFGDHLAKRPGRGALCKSLKSLHTWPATHYSPGPFSSVAPFPPASQVGASNTFIFFVQFKSNS